MVQAEAHSSVVTMAWGGVPVCLTQTCLTRMQMRKVAKDLCL